MNIKQLIDADFFPTDDRGFYLVPMAHGEGDGYARVITTEANDAFPLLGLGAAGLPCQWDASGRPRPDQHPFFVIDEYEMDINSLVMPETQVEHVEYVVTNANDDVVDTVGTLADALSIAFIEFGDRITKVSYEMYVGNSPPAVARIYADDVTFV